MLKKSILDNTNNFFSLINNNLREIFILKKRPEDKKFK